MAFLGEKNTACCQQRHVSAEKMKMQPLESPKTAAVLPQAHRHRAPGSCPGHECSARLGGGRSTAGTGWDTGQQRACPRCTAPGISTEICLSRELPREAVSSQADFQPHPLFGQHNQTRLGLTKSVRKIAKGLTNKFDERLSLPSMHKISWAASSPTIS